MTCSFAKQEDSLESGGCGWAGIFVKMETAAFSVGGMSCASCVGRVEKALNAVPGVKSASVNLASERATIEYSPAQASVEDLEMAVRSAGFEVREPSGKSNPVEVHPDEKALKSQLAIAAIFSIPL